MTLKQYPFYIKGTVILLGLVLLCYALVNLKGILAPISFAVIIAILLNPLELRLRKAGINKVLSITIAILIGFLVVGGILYFLSSQVIKFGQNFDLLKEKFYTLLHQLQQWIASNFGITVKKQITMLNDAMSSGQEMLGKTVGSALGTMALIFLVPVYVFLFLYYKTLFLNFLHEVFAEKNTERVSDVLTQTKGAIQSYMVGLLLEAIVVAILNSTALLLLGVDYAILLGVIGAILNMLPYIGGIVAITLPVLIALVTKEGYSTPVGVIISYGAIQFIDNHLLVPLLVSSRVKINAFFSILIVLLGGALWGVTGMFLSIPFLAILKIIFDRIPELKPWGKLLGEEVSTLNRRQRLKRRRKTASVAEKIVESAEKK